MKMRNGGLTALVVGAMLAVGCSESREMSGGPTSVGGADGGRVSTQAVAPPSLTAGPGTGNEAGSPAGPALGLPNTCDNSKAAIRWNVSKERRVTLQTDRLAGQTATLWFVRHADNKGAMPIKPRTEIAADGLYNTSDPLPVGTYQARSQPWRQTCTPQAGTASEWVTFSINGPGDNPDVASTPNIVPGSRLG